MKILQRLIICFTFMSMIAVGPASAQEINPEEWKTFRSEEYKFRFTYPTSWVVKEGRGPNIKAVVSNNQSDNASCNVVVRSDEALSFLDDSFYADMTKEDIKEMTPSGFDFIEGGTTYVDNKNAAYIYMAGNYKTMDISVSMKSLMVSTIVKGKMYVITCASLQNSFDRYKPTLKRIISTLVFEYYNEEYTIADSLIEENYTYFWLSIIISLILTWGIGLTPPLLIRYVFFKRPMKKKRAIAVCGLFLFINMFIFIALGSESKSHTALILVTFISYWILKKDTSSKPNKIDNPNS